MAYLEYRRYGWPERIDRHRRSTSFHRYWDYYGRVMEWKSRHRIAWWTANFAAERFENEALRHRLGLCPNDPGRSGPPHGFRRATINCRSVDNYDAPEVDCQRPIGSSEIQVDDCEDDPVFEMEVTEDMLAFLEKSDQHRRQLRAERKAAVIQEKKNAISEEDVACGPPGERPGAKRTAEMKQLYGRRAATIHGMETAVQLGFHRNCDHHQPKLWPNIPIRLQFK